MPNTGSTIQELLIDGRRSLSQTPETEPREALTLLSHLLELSEAQVLARASQPVDEDIAGRMRSLIERRRRHEPVAYLTGTREFYGRSFQVDRRVLIPRPESEHLIETAIELDLGRALDLGTGSGCLAVSLALETDGHPVVAADVSPAALALARTNAERLGAADRVRFLAMNLANAISVEHFDLVISNPPYIREDERSQLAPDILNYEPHAALFAGQDGLQLIQRLLAELAGMKSGAHLLLEIGHRQLHGVAQLASESSFELLSARRDYSDIPRVVVLRRR